MFLVRAALVACGVLFAMGCNNLDAPFSCTDNAQCIFHGVQGGCEPSGFCSFADTTCGSGARYGAASAADLAGKCTNEVLPDAGSDAALDGAADGQIDAPFDAPIDSAIDAPPDAPPDSSIDSPVDAPPDAAPVSGCVTQISASYRHSCAVRQDGRVFCWGWNLFGQLGDGTQTDRNSPSQVSSLTNVAQIGTGPYHTCARLSTGGVRCWGGNSSGELGDGSSSVSSSTPVTVTNGIGALTGVTDLASGPFHNCVRYSSGSVGCWGAGLFGELGNGASLNSYSAKDVMNLTDATQVAVGANFSCALRAGGSVMCWGWNALGQLGNGSTSNSNVPTTVMGLPSNVQSIFGHQGNAMCARTSGNQLYCWGQNTSGQIGDGTTTNRTSAVLVPDVQAETGSTGLLSTCSQINGSVSCSGQNLFGQFGSPGTPTISPNATVVPELYVIEALTSGYYHSCGLTSTGGVQCWGNNQLGQVGSGMRLGRESPVSVSGLTGATQVSAGFQHTCVRRSSGGAVCWGANESGQLGDGTRTTRLTPAVVNLTLVSAVAAGADHSCALRSTGAVSCWGDNASGELGNNSTTDALTPVQATNSAAMVAVGIDFSCALKTDGTVDCWGSNANGQIGDGTGIGPRLNPTKVTGLTNVSQIAVGSVHACALKMDGSIVCWGFNGSGQLGDSTLTTRTAPVTVTSIGGPAVAIAAGRHHTCAVRSNNTAYCWGLNSSGQLGLGNTTNRSTPGAVSLSSVSSIAAGGSNTCAQRTDGTVACWGQTEWGAVGDGGYDNDDQLTPRLLGASFTVSELAVGSAHVCARRPDGTVSCWGQNTSGQIGDGTRMSVPPTEVTFPTCL